MKLNLLKSFSTCIYFLLFGFMLSNKSFAANDVRIYEIYGGGGNAGATYNQDFIVLYNNGVSAVSLMNWSLQYATSTSTTTNWDKLDLTGLTIQPKGFLLIGIAINNTTGTGSGTSTLPTLDKLWPFFQNGGIAVGAGKIALMSNLTTINTTSPPALGLVDFVGYGSPNAFEGTGAAPSPSNINAIVRKINGQDTDNNSVDFVLTNSAAPSVIRPSNSSAFPIKLTQFTANVLNEKEAELKWQTSSEANFSHFLIQRSFDAIGFETIGKEASKGNSNNQNNYSFIDEKPFLGQNYYRLKQVDIDGSEEFSKIISLNVLDDIGFRVFPNPTFNSIEIQGVLPTDIEKIRVIDVSGKVLHTYFPSNNSIDISPLAPQVLLIETYLHNGSKYQKRVIKQ